MNFTVYSKSGCNHCEKIRTVLQLAQLTFVEYKLDEHFDYKSFHEQFGTYATFPQVVLNGENLGGCQDSIRYMQEQDICCNV